MKKYLILAAVLMAITACKEEKAPAPKLVIGDIKLSSLDVVYASQDAVMESGMSALDTNIEKMQKVLNAWPQAMQTNQQPCYMILRNETARFLSLKDGIATPNSEVDYKFECRQSINYVYDKKRTHDFWKSL